MGYTTKFKGELTITPYPSAEIIKMVNEISKERHNDDEYPGIWCQWIINSKGKLEWNGAEKFNNYIEWLQYLVENVFKSRGYALDGCIRYRGERFEDIGVIYVKENIVKNLCGVYDMPDNEIIIAVTMNEYGKAEIEVL